MILKVQKLKWTQTKSRKEMNGRLQISENIK